MSDPQPRISTETALRLLTKKPRRQLLRRVAETPDGTTVDQLTEHLEDADPATPRGKGTPDSQFVELYHLHLPMLAEANVITYDTTRGTVQRGRRFHDVLSLLEVIDSHREDASKTVA